MRRELGPDAGGRYLDGALTGPALLVRRISVRPVSTIGGMEEDHSLSGFATDTYRTSSDLTSRGPADHAYGSGRYVAAR